MKRIFVLLLAIILIYNAPVTATASETTSNGVPKELHVATIMESTEVDNLAKEYLYQAKIMLAANSSVRGFSEFELANASLGKPFSIYVLNESKQFVPSNTWVYPIFCENDIVGVMEVCYNSTKSKYFYTLGRAYADNLNRIRYSGNVDAGSILFVGQVADKLFITDGINIDVLSDMPTEQMATITTFELEDICANLETESFDYAVICETEVEVISAIPDAVPFASIVDTLNLDVPYVEQTGICGVAAWASVLNYRFGTSYTNDSLALEMADSYTNGNADGVIAPTMKDYRDFANDKYNAGCVYVVPPSLLSVKTIISNNKPIMGYWESGTGSDFKTHAILITGYSYKGTVPAEDYYIVRNPWYTYAQWIGVTDSSSVVYVNGSRTWKLKSVVY